ncbi:MAG: thiamine phosphate synthase [Planctomycetota bacterium]
MDVTRALDANLNRALEALRVVEDYARFVVARPGVARKAKALRHATQDAVASLVPATQRLEARDAEGDPGRAGGVLAPPEAGRSSVEQVALANLARAQEALRALEEFSKPASPEVASRLSQQRYAVYTLGQELLRPAIDWSGREVYAILGPRPGREDVVGLAGACLAGGVRLLQLRLKQGSDRERLRITEAVQQRCLDHDAWLIVNDRVDLAQLVGARGVHLGVDDLPPERVRSLLGSGCAIGASAHDGPELERALSAGVDYVGFGTLYRSGTKPELRAQGLETLRRLAPGAGVPIFGIGGVDLENAGEVIAAGASGVAVGGALLDAPDVARAAAQLCERVATALAEREP